MGRIEIWSSAGGGIMKRVSGRDEPEGFGWKISG